MVPDPATARRGPKVADALLSAIGGPLSQVHHSRHRPALRQRDHRPEIASLRFEDIATFDFLDRRTMAGARGKPTDRKSVV